MFTITNGKAGLQHGPVNKVRHFCEFPARISRKDRNAANYFIFLAGYQPIDAMLGIHGLGLFDIGKVLLIGNGVVVGVFHIGDKEVIGGIIGVQGGIKGIDTGIGNGADGQAAAVVGIVGIQYRLRHIIIIVRLHIVPDEIIGGAAFQPGVFAGIGKAVVEYRGNIVHLLHAGAFLLHDGGKDDPFLQRKAAVL